MSQVFVMKKVRRQLRGPRSRAGDRLGESGSIQGDKFSPSTLGFDLVIDRRAIADGHIRYAPAMQGWIHFDFGCYLGGSKGFLQLDLGIRLALVVIRRDPEIRASFDLRCEQMRAIGFVGYQASAVERSARANTIGQCG